MTEAPYRAAALAFALTLLATSASAEDAKCGLKRIAALDMEFDGEGRVNVPMTINGRAVKLMVDTGGAISTLTESTVTSLALNPRSSGYVSQRMYGGEEMNRYVAVEDAKFGGIPAPRLDFFVMQDDRISSDEGGLIGPDILRQFDLDFDFANTKLSLFSQDHCPGRVVYWTQSAYAQIKFDMDRNGHILLPVWLDGKEVDVELDTGADLSVGSLEDIEDEFKIDEKSPDLKPVSEAVADDHVYRYPFKTMDLDGVAIYNPDLYLVPNSVSHMRHTFLLGMNILRQLHLYIAYGERVLYVTPASAK